MATARTARQSPRGLSNVPEDLWRLLMENLPDAVTLVDREGTVLVDNRGPSPSWSGKGASLYDHLPEGCRGHVRESLAAVFQTGQPQYYEVEDIGPGGSVAWYGHRIEPVRDEDGAGVARAIIITTDITRYKSEERAVRHEQRLEESRRLASIAELAAGVSHEINNPLAVVQGYAEVLLDSNLPQEALAQIENIHAAAKRAARIVRDLNQLARHTEPTKLSINLKALMGQAIDLRKREFAAGNIRFITDFPPDLPFVLADPYQLMEGLLNILTNAQQAVAEVPRPGEIRCQAQVVDGQVRLSISDNGPGIAPEILGRVFDPFFTTRPTGTGPGLGLSISYAVIHQNGGEIWAESTPGQGATFHIQFPVHPPD